MEEPTTSSSPSIDPLQHLPLSFFTSDVIPPAPTRSQSAIDWLPDFAGYSWLAYGASSVLVISHLPSPLSPEETAIGPILRQVLHISSDSSSPVISVSWSPVSPSVGEVAASSDNRVRVFSSDSSTSEGSFCWGQNAVLVQSTKVEAIKWTGSGDGIVAGGIDVVLWRRRNRSSWEIAWKFRADQPQNLVSASWSVDAPFATAAGFQCEVQSKVSNEAGNNVLLVYSNGTSEYTKANLHHPHRVSMIQWRPLKRRPSWSDYTNSLRHVLLTCCFDGTVRLWTEVDNGKVRKLGKESHDHKNVKRSFCVSAVIEVNQALNGNLGGDIFLTWAVEISGIFKNREGTNQLFSVGGDGRESRDRVSKCEWLISFGPGTLVTFWAIHCLDDTSPMRFPRITLWKKQELDELEVPYPRRAGFSNLRDRLLLDKVVILRNCLSDPPEVCSLIHIIPCNFLVRSSLYADASSKEGTSLNEGRIGNYSLYSGGGVLNAGHTGKILQVAIHPHLYAVQIAASLDSNGSLMFWSVSAVSNGSLGLPTWIPSWKLHGEFSTHDSSSKCTSMRWAPPIFGDDRMLLMGHARGLDCFMVKVSQNSEDVLCCYVCTIPLHHGPYENGPTNIFAIPLPSNCDKTVQYSKFLLLGIWMKDFRALSWEIIVHSCDSSTSYCECSSDNEITSLCCKWKFKVTFANKRYCFGVNPCSSQFPELHSADQVTSFSVACPVNFIARQENFGFNRDLCAGLPAYEMATGYLDGTVKLWRCNSSRHSTPGIPWDLVGKFAAHHGPVTAISLTDSGRKIATISKSHSESITTLHIWESVNLIGTGFFLLEDRIPFDKDIVALNWLDLGNGQLFLGICLQNELQVYAQKHSDSQILLSCEKFWNLCNWSCIAVAHTFPSISDFLWGPQATPVLIHDNFLRLLGQTVFPLDSKQQAQYLSNFTKEGHDDGENKGICFFKFTNCDVGINSLEKYAENGNVPRKCAPSVLINGKKEYMSIPLSVDGAQLKHSSSGILDSWSLMEVAEKLQETLPVYHPKVLFMNIYSGNWKRACISLSHLVEYLTSASEEGSNTTGCNYLVPQILLSNYFEGLLVKDSTETGFQQADARIPTSSSQFFAYDTKVDAFNSLSGSSSRKSDLSSYIEPLEKFYELAALTNVEKLQILAIVDLLGEVQQSASSYETLDEPGRRFWVALRFQQLNFFRSFGRRPSTDELAADARMMCWAFHSDCQEILLSSFLPNESSWKEMRNLGVGFWFTNAAQLRTRMEKLARQQYLRNKDPKDCALLYIALNRRQVLAGLFKLSRDEKDKPLVGFLSRNFQEEKNKAAALKNAYVLMGRHQLELAVAFFLLGGDTQSAVTVCAKNLQDEQLSLVICRLIEGRGGPLEHHLITKVILQSASERGDYWLTSLLEWELGNYLKSFQSMLVPVATSSVDDTALSSNHVAFMDPHVGLYCLSLATKNSTRNAVGEQNAAILGRWATFVTATALNRSGLPLEALECFSSSLSMVGGGDQASCSGVDNSAVICGILRPSPMDSCPWLSADVALHLESCLKLELALRYFTKLVMEHPQWSENVFGSLQACRCSKDCEFHQYKKSRGNVLRKLFGGVSKIEQKFAVDSSCIITMIIIWLWNGGLPFIGYDILVDHTACNELLDESHAVDNTILHPVLYKPLWNSIGDISFLLSRFVTLCNMMCIAPKSRYVGNDMSVEARFTWLNSQKYSFRSILSALWSSRTAIRVFSGSEDVVEKSLLILDLFEYCIHFAFAWLKQNSEVLLLMMQPLLASKINVNSSYEVDKADMKNILHHTKKLLACTFPMDDLEEGHKVNRFVPGNRNGKVIHTISEDEKWYVLGACLWRQMCKFMINKLHSLCGKPEYCSLSNVSNGKIAFWEFLSDTFESHGGNLSEKVESFALILAESLKATLVHISSYHLRLLGSFLHQKVENRLHPSTLVWLEESSQPQAKSLYQASGTNMMNSNDNLSSLDELWCKCVQPNLLSECFEQEKISPSRLFNNKLSKVWSDVWKDIEEHETSEISNEEVGTNSNSSSPSNEEVGTPAKSLFRNGRTFLSSWQKETAVTKEFSHFQPSKEIYKRDGELLEALCVNSVNERQAAVASNRKGISFFSWEDEIPCEYRSDYIWSDADWPLNGWAGAESTPLPTCVSPGVGLGSKKGAHLGLGGATIGVATFARPKRDLTGGGAFRAPGYAGIGASRLGWEVQEDFDEFIDPPATVENISTRAFSSHPSRPLFLVGSSNTHIYLWEFGKDKAIATYGVLPAANVPPPYALASISSLQFDHYGHRFATAALDGTVCTWHLEVGGRSNIHPTESSVCFNGHASDVSYLASSGSVIAAAGFSSNSVNVVIWDTLAPPTTSRASSVCHEGGARSVSVFDNDIGSGSISPLIVTGGKSGDVGLHDFRYIATGKTKRHRHFENGDASSNASSNTDMQTGIGNKVGDHNSNGMLWYIPKAHLGSVTKISTIPHTSLFLTGSKDGDVKLWDAKTARLVCHWPKLHERRTFLQPSTRGFGGVDRAGVTDIQVVSHGFLTCGGDGSVKLVQCKDYQHLP